MIDEAAKYRREMEALRRQDCDLQDELVRMRQGAQRAQELQFLLDSERQTTQRLKTDYETMKLELEKIGGGGGGGGGLTSPSFPVLSTSNTTTSSPQQQQQLQEELENKKQQLSNLQNQYDSLELRLKENIKQLESTHRIRMEELENQHYKRLDDLKASHRTEYERLESLNNENQSKARRYELELKEKLLDLEAYEAKYLDLKGKNKDLYDQIHELEKKVLELNYQQKGEIKNIHDRNQHDLSRLQEEIQVYHHEKLQWKDEKNVLERSVEKLKDELKKKEQEMETFIEKLKDSEQIHEEKLSKNEEKLRNQTSERDEKKLHEQASLIHRLQEQVEAYQGREQQLYLEIEKKLKEEKYQHGIKDRKIEELEEELLAIQSEVEERTRLKGQETGGAGGGLVGDF